MFLFSGQRLRQFTIYVGEKEESLDLSKYEVCAKVCHTQTARKRTYSCKSELLGSRVVVHMDITSEVLTLCEVEVYTNPLQGKHRVISHHDSEGILQEGESRKLHVIGIR